MCILLIRSFDQAGATDLPHTTILVRAPACAGKVGAWRVPRGACERVARDDQANGGKEFHTWRIHASAADAVATTVRPEQSRCVRGSGDELFRGSHWAAGCGGAGIHAVAIRIVRLLFAQDADAVLYANHNLLGQVCVYATA